MNDDLIRRSDAIGEITNHCENECYYRVDNWCPQCQREEFQEAIKAVPSAETPQWIPCSERLPSEKDYIGDVVIWCTDKSIVGVGWYYESTKSWATIDDTFPPILGEVIAWMPLPKPWKGADDE